MFKSHPNFEKTINPISSLSGDYLNNISAKIFALSLDSDKISKNIIEKDLLTYEKYYLETSGKEFTNKLMGLTILNSVVKINNVVAEYNVLSKEKRWSKDIVNYYYNKLKSVILAK